MPPKCGVTSFSRVVLPNCKGMNDFRRQMHAMNRGPKAPDEIIDEKAEKLLVVRDPVERFASLWRDGFRDGNKRALRAENVKRGFHSVINKEYAEHRTPEALISYIERYPIGNPHWFPQYGYLVPGTRVMTLPALFDELGLSRAHENKTRRKVSDPQMPVDRIRRQYIQDVQLFSLCSP